MKRMNARKFRFIAIAISIAVLLPVALAGPPLLCHPFGIGSANSLPWASGEKSWNAPKEDYNTQNLVRDTLQLLNDRTPVIVRMETLRRAALYSNRDAAAGRELLAQLKARAFDGRNAPTRLFDYGYMIETLKQAMQTGPASKAQNPLANLTGYEYLQQALQLSAHDPQMEFAAALVTSWPKQASQADHLRKALAGAAGDSLLEENLISHFSDRGKTLAEMRTSLGMIARKD